MKQNRKQQKESTRQHIVEKAYEIYSLRGFAIPSKDIASNAGVAEGTIFAHFSTVQNLIVHLIEQFGHQLTIELHYQVDKQGSIADFLATHIDVISKHEMFYSRVVQEQASLPNEAIVSFICLQSAVSHHLSELIQREARVKKIPQYIIFNTWIGLLHYYLLNRDLFCDEASKSVLQTQKAVLIDSFVSMIIE